MGRSWTQLWSAGGELWELLPCCSAVVQAPGCRGREKFVLELESLEHSPGASASPCLSSPRYFARLICKNLPHPASSERKYRQASCLRAASAKSALRSGEAVGREMTRNACRISPQSERNNWDCAVLDLRLEPISPPCSSLPSPWPPP